MYAQPQKGTLKVNVKSLELGSFVKGVNTIFGGKFFLVLKIGQQRQKSLSISPSNLKVDYFFTFQLNGEYVLDIEVERENTFKSQSKIGWVNHNFSYIFQEQKRDIWLNLQRDGGKLGKIHMILNFTPDQSLNQSQNNYNYQQQYKNGVLYTYSDYGQQNYSQQYQQQYGQQQQQQWQQSQSQWNPQQQQQWQNYYQLQNSQQYYPQNQNYSQSLPQNQGGHGYQPQQMEQAKQQHLNYQQQWQQSNLHPQNQQYQNYQQQLSNSGNLSNSSANSNNNNNDVQFAPGSHEHNDAHSSSHQQQNKTNIDDLPDEQKCVICMDGTRDGIFYKCGHRACCADCGPSFVGKPCPICRVQVYDFVKTFDA